MCACVREKGWREGRGDARFGNAAGFVTSRPRLVRLSGQSADDYYTDSNGNATIIFISRALRGTSDVWRAYRGGVWSRALGRAPHTRNFTASDTSGEMRSDKLNILLH